MKWLIAALVLACGLLAGYFLVPGFRARTEVAGDKALHKLDRLLGEMDVQHKEVQITMSKMENALEELTKGRILAKVQAERLEKQAKDIDQKLADVDSSLKRLRDLVAKETSVDIAGKTYTANQVRDLAAQVLQRRKSLETQQMSLRNAQGRLQKAAQLLESRENAAKEQLVTLKGQLQEIESEMVALKSLRKRPGRRATAITPSEPVSRSWKRKCSPCTTAFRWRPAGKTKNGARRMPRKIWTRLIKLSPPPNRQKKPSKRSTKHSVITLSELSFQG